MAKLTLQQTLDKSLKTAKQYIDNELAKKANTHDHPYLPTAGGTLTGPISVSGESRFYSGTYTDPWTGINCAIKATGNIATTGVVRGNTLQSTASYDGTTAYTATPLGLSYFVTNDTDNGSPSLYSTTLTVKEGDNRQFQLSSNNGASHLYFRSAHVNNTGGTGTGWTSWKKIYHEGHKPTPADIGASASGHTHSYIPLAGTSDYTITGNLLFSNSGTTSGAFRGLQGRNGETDYWRVGGSQTGSNGGYTEIASADDGNEPIYARQYTGAFSTLVRTATLLDASGNTTFPGTVTASSFSGSFPGVKRRYRKVIDLTNTTTYPVDKWYPCTAGIPNDGMNTIEIANQLDGSSKPSWSTHASGFTCNLHLMVIANGWGTAAANSICLNHSYSWCNNDPCGYSQLNNSSNAVLWLRGGGKYNVYTSWDATWTPRTASTTLSEQTVAPATSCPGISLTRATMMANINGNASSVGGYSVWVGTQTEYNALSSKSSTTIYYIKG